MELKNGTKGNEVWIWSVVVELKDETIKKFLFAGDRSLIDNFFVLDNKAIRLKYLLKGLKDGIKYWLFSSNKCI